MSASSHCISATALARRIGTRNAPQVIDVRRREAFEASDRVIAGARWRDPAALESWAGELAPSGDVVVYCVHGHRVSQGVMSVLRSRGLPAAYLAGGIEAFSREGGPSIARRPELHLGNGPSRWVTRERPKIDRLACPWLVRRFVDPRARIHYVAPDQVLGVAEELDAIAFDVEGAPLSHVGERCSFDALIEYLDVRDDALRHLAGIVRGADTARLDLAPECAGLLACSLGISALNADDHAALDQAIGLYDALYAWSRHAREEAHGWPSARG